MTPDQLRGHELLPGGLREGVPSLYATEENKAEDKVVWVHFFCAAFDWWLCEIGDREEVDLCFGYVTNRQDARSSEWGYWSMVELAALLVPARASAGGLYPPVYVERDLSWTPTRFGDIRVL